MLPKKKTAGLKPDTIRIRMYRVGFGDCFLLSIPNGNGHKHVVIDCGVHGSGNIKTIGLAVENIRTETGSKIAAIIATHSHQDHISGFSEAWEMMDVEQVWLPWSEDPMDELALKWSKKQAKLAEDLMRHFVAQAALNSADASTPDRKKAVNAVFNLVGSEDALGLLGAAAASNAGKLASNAKAMKRLKEGLKDAEVKYLEAGKVMPNALGIAGLEVQVLGPPREERFLKDMDPPQAEEFVKLAVLGKGIESVNKIHPFPPHWIVDEKVKGFIAPIDAKKRTDLKKVLLDTSLNALAFALDSFKNNTSLVTLFVFRGQYLL
ncbi:MAG: MBL fold metallo-hydrolase, partial [Acidobacteriota bacterium]